MFHRLQGSTDQFIRSTYDSASGRSRQKVVFSQPAHRSFCATDERLELLPDDELAFLADWFNVRDVAVDERVQQEKATSAKKNLDELLAALKKYPPSPEDDIAIVSSCKALFYFLRPPAAKASAPTANQALGNSHEGPPA